MRSTAWLTVGLLLLGCGPLGPLPGGRLSGDRVASPPADWSLLDHHGNIQLETRPSAPYSVNLWGAGLGAHFYLASGAGGEARWVAHIAQNPDVRLRLGQSIYELRAVRVTDDAERGRFLQALKRKYDWEPSGEESQQAWLFRPDPR